MVMLCLFLASCNTIRSRQYKERHPDPEPEGTYNTEKDPYYQVDPPVPKRAWKAIYTKHAADYLSGNPCMTEFTHTMGFEYVSYDEYPHDQYGPLGFFFYNISSRIGVIFRGGPFWKIKVNRKLEECSRVSGDFIGLR